MKKHRSWRSIRNEWFEWIDTGGEKSQAKPSANWELVTARRAIAVIAALATSCSGPPAPRMAMSDLDVALKDLDGAGKADSIVLLVNDYGTDGLDTATFPVQLIYCRSLASTGATRAADSLYRRYIARSRWIDHKWRFNSEYLIMLANSGKKETARMRQYADTLVNCCADSMHSFKDMRALHYFLASQAEGDCGGMRIWLDSMAYWAPQMAKRLADDDEIEGYRNEMLGLCP